MTLNLPPKSGSETIGPRRTEKTLKHYEKYTQNG